MIRHRDRREKRVSGYCDSKAEAQGIKALLRRRLNDNSRIGLSSSRDDVDERNELVVRELPQVHYVATRIRERLPKHVDLEDLVQAGVIGLLKPAAVTTGRRMHNSQPLPNSELRRNSGQSAQA